VFPVQVTVAQSVDCPGQSLAATHCTQLPVPSHTPVTQVVPELSECVVQMPPLQITLVQPPAAGCAQSVSWTQPLPTAHGGQLGPPQSTSVSPSFLIPSWHVGGGVMQVPLPLHTMPAPHGVPATALPNTQTLAVQPTTVVHTPGAEQSAALTHSTHAPLPSHTPVAQTVSESSG
jgi:hypothetical protein